MKFIRGNAIAHATRYELYKKVDESSYDRIGTQYIGKKQYNNRGYFNAIGALTEGTASTSNYVYTDMIDVARLVDYVVDESAPDYKVCAQVLTGDEDQVAAVFYSSTDRSSKVYYMTYNDVIGAGGFKAAIIQSIAQEHNAGYVSFSSYAGNVDYIDVCFNNDIFFCLDDYAEALTSGDVLVVVAVGEGDTDTDGDGIIYTDSDYSNAVVYSTTTDEAEDELQGTWVFNDDLSGLVDIDGINFTSNGTTYSRMRCSDGGTGLELYYGTTLVREAEGYWNLSAYKTIIINENIEDTTFVAWLKANATKQGASTPTLITFTIDGASYQAEEGMTWKEWANSEYNTSRYFWGDYSNAILSQDGLTSNYVQADGVDVQGGTTIISGFAYTINSVFQGSND